MRFMLFLSVEPEHWGNDGLLPWAKQNWAEIGDFFYWCRINGVHVFKFLWFGPQTAQGETLDKDPKWKYATQRDKATFKSFKMNTLCGLLGFQEIVGVVLQMTKNQCASPNNLQQCDPVMWRLIQLTTIIFVLNAMAQSKQLTFLERCVSVRRHDIKLRVHQTTTSLGRRVAYFTPVPIWLIVFFLKPNWLSFTDMFFMHIVLATPTSTHANVRSLKQMKGHDWAAEPTTTWQHGATKPQNHGEHDN